MICDAATGAVLFLVVVVAQRLAEHAWARRNTARLLARGAREVGAEHYPFMGALHAAWVLALAGFGHDETVRPGWLAAYAGLQLLRVWILTTLGSR